MPVIDPDKIPIIDHRGIVNWERFQDLIMEATLRGYLRGLKDMRDEDISLAHIPEAAEEVNQLMKEHYYE